jgi:hypothetical protein
VSDDKPEWKTRRVKLKDPRPITKSKPKSRLAHRALNNAAGERMLARQGGPNAAGHLAEAERR